MTRGEWKLDSILHSFGLPATLPAESINEWLKTGLGRNTPNMPSVVKNDPWWFADPHRAAYTKQALLGATVPPYWCFNPAYA